MVNIWGIKIIPIINLPVNSMIGLYLNGGKSELRYSESELVGVSEEYSTGFIAKTGLPKISESGNLKYGGSSCQYKQTSIILKNVQRLNKIFEYYKINIIGATIQIIEFKGIESDSDFYSSDVEYTGVCEDVSWDETYIKISVNWNKDKLRRVNLLDDSSGVEIPVTIGQSDPLNGRFFKSVLSVDNEKVLTNGEIAGLPNYTIEANIIYQQSYFTCFGDPEPPYDFVTLRLYEIPYTASETTIINNLIGKFLVCREGNSENVGKYRQIVDVQNINLTDEYSVLNTTAELVLSDFFFVWPSGNVAANDENQSWFEIVEIDNLYSTDFINCEGFFNNSNEKIENEIQVYKPDSNDNIKQINFSDIALVDNTNFSISSRSFENSFKNLKNFSLFSVENLTLYNRLTGYPGFTKAFEEFGVGISNYQKLQPGVFVSTYGVGTTIISGPTITGEDNYKNKTYSSYYRHNVTFQGYPRIWIAFLITLPKIPNDLTFDNAYLLINSKSENSRSLSTSGLKIISRGIIGRVKNIVQDKNDYSGSIVADCCPDFLFINNPELKNKYFYVHDNNAERIQGYQNFNLNVSNKKEYDSIYEVLLMFYRDDVSQLVSFTEITTITEIAVAFETSIDADKELFI